MTQLLPALQTLLCGNMAGDQLVQVTTGGVRLLSAASGASMQQWQPPAGLQINVAAASATQVSGITQMRRGVPAKGLTGVAWDGC